MVANKVVVQTAGVAEATPRLLSARNSRDVHKGNSLLAYVGEVSGVALWLRPANNIYIHLISPVLSLSLYVSGCRSCDIDSNKFLRDVLW